MESEVTRAFRYCEDLVRNHYENFPVASWFVPSDKRPYVSALYAFARSADDFADEGSCPAADRLRRLDEWEQNLDRCISGSAEHLIFIALGETIRRTGIPRQLLVDLLDAFRMDVTTSRFRTFNDVLGYCRLSANPVGQLVLYLFADANERTIPFSDEICTGLQLANFWQDVAPDWRKGRLYIPLEDIDRFGYTLNGLNKNVANDRFRELLRFQVKRTRDFFDRGRPLLTRCVPDLRFELALTWRGGMGILNKIENSSYDVLSARPSLSFGDKLRILMSALVKRKL